MVLIIIEMAGDQIQLDCKHNNKVGTILDIWFPPKRGALKFITIVKFCKR